MFASIQPSRRWAPLMLALAFLTPALADERPRLDTSTKATEARILNDMQYLAGDECEGRGIFTQGIHKAADYIAADFERFGLKPGGVDGTWFQPFEVTGQMAFGRNNALRLKGKDGEALELERGKEFNPLSLGASGEVKGGIVFVGYGLVSDDPAYDDFAGVDVAGKVVVMLRGVPREKVDYKPNFKDKPAAFSSLASKAAHAEKHKAAAIIFVSTLTQAGTTDRPLGQATRFGSTERVGIPTLSMKRATLEEMLKAAGHNLEEVEKNIDHEFKPNSMEITGWRCELATDVRRETVKCKNVIGVVEGSGPLAEEFIVIGAHYDHLGFGGSGSLAPGSFEIHYGADDNCSGTVSVIELARRFAQKKGRVGRTLVFQLYSAEEMGLLGSAYYCRNPLFPLEKTAAMYNMDMVGRYRPEVKLQVNGTTTAKDEYFKKIVDAANEKHKLEISTPATSQFFGASDHFSFYQKNIPVLFLFTGMHPQYHRPLDRVETINIEGVRQCVEFSETILDELASRSERPEFVRVGRQAATTPQTNPERGGPRLGVRPNYSDDKEGVLLEEVLAGGVAEKGGLKAGDRVVDMNGKPIQNIEAYMAVMRGL
ncbi:MAG TPA: M20/M25/M40 family metallo-hydrolase, partial [Gemmatales bacterium]|nr:M20/M25/M40 family metallo-hydrolase [Gemmatales bacterium]